MRKRRSSFRGLPFGRLDIGLMRNISSDAEVKPGTLRVAKNARILRGELTNVPGWRKFSDPFSSSIHLHFDEYPMKSGTTHFMSGTVGKLIYWNGTVWTDISGAVTFTGTGWSSTVFPSDDLFLITNKVENIQKWNGSGNVADLAAAAPKCGVIRVLDKHVIALDITNEPQKVQWSELDDSSNWTTGEAGSAFIDDTPDFIVGAEPLGTDLIVYKDRGIYSMSYIGAPLYMRILRRVDGIGLVGKDAVLNLEDRHIIFGPDSLWAFNGVRPLNIGGHFMPDVLDAADPSKLSNARLFFLEENDEILVMITSVSSATGYPDLAWRYNYITHTATGPEDLPAAAVGYYKEESSPFVDDIDLIVDTVDEFIDSRVFAASFPLNLFANASTKNIEKMGVVYGREGVDVGMELGFPVMDVVMLYDGKVSSVPELLKRIKGVSMRFAMAAGDSFTLNLGVSDEPTMTSMTWKGPYTISPPNNNVTFRAKGRYFTLSLTYTGQNKVTVEDIRLLVREAGPR